MREVLLQVDLQRVVGRGANRAPGVQRSKLRVHKRVGASRWIVGDPVVIGVCQREISEAEPLIDSLESGRLIVRETTEQVIGSNGWISAWERTIRAPADTKTLAAGQERGIPH